MPRELVGIQSQCLCMGLNDVRNSVIAQATAHGPGLVDRPEDWARRNVSTCQPVLESFDRAGTGTTIGDADAATSALLIGLAAPDR